MSHERKPYIGSSPDGKLLRGRTFFLQPTPYRDTVIRTDQEEGIDMSYKTVRSLRKLSIGLRLTELFTQPFLKRQEERKKKLKELAQQNPGLRGMQSENDNFIVNITPRTSANKYDDDQLKEGLGRFYSSIVSGEMQFSIPINEAKTAEDVKIWEDLFVVGLVQRGIDEETARKMVSHAADIQVNETKLAKYAKHGKVSLPEVTAQPKTVWNIDTDYLNKPPKKPKG